MKSYVDWKIKGVNDPEDRRELIKFYHEKKYGTEEEVFIMPVIKKPMVGYLIKSGFKLCSVCGYMIDTSEIFCSLCSKKFRTRIIRGNSDASKVDHEKNQTYMKKIKLVNLTSGKQVNLVQYRRLKKL